MKSLVTLPGMHTDHTLLNVVRSRGPGRIRDAVVIDNLETKPDSIISKGIVGQVGSIITTKNLRGRVIILKHTFCYLKCICKLSEVHFYQ